MNVPLQDQSQHLLMNNTPLFGRFKKLHFWKVVMKFSIKSNFTLKPVLCHFINNNNISNKNAKLNYRRVLVPGGPDIFRELIYLLGMEDDGSVCRLLCSLSNHGGRNYEKWGYSYGMNSEAHTLRLPKLFPSFFTIVFVYLSNWWLFWFVFPTVLLQYASSAWDCWDSSVWAAIFHKNKANLTGITSWKSRFSEATWYFHSLGLSAQLFF